MAKLGEPMYINKHATDAMRGTRRAGPTRRVNATEVALEATRNDRFAHPSPELSPDSNGQNRGTDAIPGARLELAPPKGEGILRALPLPSDGVQSAPDRVATETATCPDPSEPLPKTATPSPETSPEAFLAVVRSRVSVDDRGCWLWNGAKNSKGYGQIGIKVRYGRGGSVSKSVHRLVAIARYGVLPDKAIICHHCDVRGCVNPEHIYVGDTFTNAKDRRERGNYMPVRAAQNAAKTHCANGHEYNEDNTYVHPRTGERYCRTCSRASYLRHRDKKRAVA